MAVQTTSNRTWKNTFAPDCPRERISAMGMFTLIRYGRLDMGKIPDDAVPDVQRIIDRVYGR